MDKSDSGQLRPRSVGVTQSDPKLEFDHSMISGPLEFRMGHRLVTATSAKRLSSERTVYWLQLTKPSILEYIPILLIRRIVASVFNFCPFLKTCYPEWFLPPTVILKKRKLDWEGEFEVEKAMYRRLQPLQGKFVPYFYGEATYDGSPALILSEIVGQRLSELTLGPNDDKNFEGKLEEVYKALSMYGVAHEDAALHNVIDVGDRIMVVDLEQSTIEDTEWEGSTNWGSVGDILRLLQQNRQYEYEKGRREKKAIEGREERRRLWCDGSDRHVLSQL